MTTETKPRRFTLPCWLRGHEWEQWSEKPVENVAGIPYRVRHCRYCTAQDFMRAES